MLYWIFQMTYRFKHSSFREENEWRFVSLRAENLPTGEPQVPEVKFRATNVQLIPYIEIPIHDKDKDAFCFDITRIKYGPTSKPNLMQKSIEMLLKKMSVVIVLGTTLATRRVPPVSRW
jgi:hypothetical protein